MEHNKSTENTNVENTRAPFIQHLAELKRRLIWCLLFYFGSVIFSYYFAGDIYTFLVKPLAAATEGEGRRLIYTGLAEAFITYIKLALFAGLIISFPVLAWHLYRFIAPGLYENEKKVFLPYLFAAPLMFFIGALLAYYLVFPMAWKFFVGFELAPTNGMPIHLEARVSEYLSISMQIILAFALCFQMPVVLTLLSHVGFISVETLKSKRKIAIVVIFVIAAIITPPDVLSQLLLAVPLVLLYEISIFAASLAQRKSSELW